MNTNWAGNLTFTGQRWHRPSTVDELRSLVRRAERIHAVGAGHSFSAVADGAGDLVSLAGLPPILELDPAGGTVTVAAGVRYGELAPFLHRRGYALANLASLPHLTVAGAVATATHGSGRRNQSLAAAVTALRLVTASGDLVKLEREHPDFAGAVVNLGALGVVADLTLAVEPTFEVEQYVYDGLPAERLTGHFAGFAEVFGAGYSVSAFTDWSGPAFGQVWVKRRTGAEPPARWLGAELADGPRHPVPGMLAGAVHRPARRARPLVPAAAALPAGVHAERRQGVAVGIPAAGRVGPGGTRGGGPARSAGLARCCRSARSVRWPPTSCGCRWRTSVTVWRCTSPGNRTSARCRRYWSTWSGCWHRSSPGRTGASCTTSTPSSSLRRYPRWADFTQLRHRYDPTGKFASPVTGGWD